MNKEGKRKQEDRSPLNDDQARKNQKMGNDSFDFCQRVSSIMDSYKTKEVNKEQPSYRNLSATATRVLQCTRSQQSCCSF
jgi:hypothetical protein